VAVARNDADFAAPAEPADEDRDADT
jgi:hypothetical protein